MKGKKRIARFLSLLLIFIFIFPTLASCSSSEDVIYYLEQLKDEKYMIGVPNGAASMTLAQEYFGEESVTVHYDMTTCYASLSQGKTDALFFDSNILNKVAMRDSSYTVLNDSVIGEIDLVVGISRETDSENLKARVDAFLSTFVGSSTQTAMEARWFDSLNPSMPYIEPANNPTETIVVATECANEPMTYYGEDQEILGYDIELAYRIASYLNVKIEFLDLNWTGCLAAVETGKADLFISNVNATEDNKTAMDYSEPYLTSEICALVMTDRAEKTYTKSAKYDLEDLAGMNFGSVTGSTFDAFTLSVVPDANIVYSNTFTDLITMLETGKIDAYFMDEPIAEFHANSSKQVTYFEIEGIYQQFAYAASKYMDETAKTELMVYLNQIALNGVLDDFKAEWTASILSEKDIIDYENLPATNGTIKAVCSDTLEPFSYVQDGTIIGYDVDILATFCQEYGYALEVTAFTDMTGGLLEVETGMSDLFIGCLTVTEERAEVLDFLPVIYEGGLVVCVPSVIPEFDSLYQLEGKVISQLEGTILFDYCDMFISDYVGLEYKNTNDQVIALKTGTIDAIIYDLPIAQLLVAQNPEFTLMSQTLSTDDYVFALQKNSNYTGILNEYIATMKEDGTYEELVAKWIDGDDDGKYIDDMYKEDKGGYIGEITYYCLDTGAPMSYCDDNNEAAGFEAELIYRFAYEYNFKLNVVTGSFTTMMASLEANKCDIISGIISYTDERAESFDLSTSHYSGSVVMIVRDVAFEEDDDGVGFFAELQESFYNNFIKESRWKLIVQGIGTTVYISVAAAILGTMLGFIICFARRSKSRFFTIPATIFIKIMQGTPIVVMLMILYYIVFASVDMTALYVAILGFAFNFGAYTSEMIRTGMDAVDVGQIEAAKALGFGKVRIFFFIHLPQAARHFLPVYRGEFISMVKMTSVVGYISVQDLTKMSDIIRSRTYEAFFPLIATALIYFALAFLLVWILTVFEKKLQPKSGNKKIKGVKNDDKD